MKFIESAKGALNKTKIKVVAHSPEILLGVGIVGVVAGVVTACVATVKATKVVEETKETVDNSKALVGCATPDGVYTEEECKKETTELCVKTAGKVALLYLPSVLLVGGSIASFIGSNRIMQKRNAELTAMAGAISAAFAEYRRRTKDKYGEEADDELYYGIKTKEIVSPGDDGSEVKSTLDFVEDNPLSPYVFYFEKGTSTRWEDCPQMNVDMLRAVQNMFNHKLGTYDGNIIFMNDVLDELGMERTKAGQRVGWIYTTHPEDPNNIVRGNCVCDNYIDFHIKKVKRVDPATGEVYDSVMLDFNVDGDVWSLMK